MACRGMPGHAKAWQGMARHAMAWHGMPWHGMPCHGTACVAGGRAGGRAEKRENPEFMQKTNMSKTMLKRTAAKFGAGGW